MKGKSGGVKVSKTSIRLIEILNVVQPKICKWTQIKLGSRIRDPNLSGLISLWFKNFNFNTPRLKARGTFTNLSECFFKEIDLHQYSSFTIILL